MSFELHDCFKFKGVEDSLPEYSTFSKGSKFIQKQIITPAKILDIKTTTESLTYRNFQANNRQCSINTQQRYLSEYFFK